MKSITVSIVSPSTCHKGMGPNAMGSVVKNLPASAEDAKDMGPTPLGWEDPLEEKTATHSSNLAWRIPWTEEFGRLTVQGVEKSQT